MRGHKVWLGLVAAHAVVVVGLLALFTLMEVTSDPEDGANIGAGLVGLVLLACGLPWTIPMFATDKVQELPTLAAYIVEFAPAVLNVVIHAALYKRFTSRVRASRRR